MNFREKPLCFATFFCREPNVIDMRTLFHSPGRRFSGVGGNHGPLRLQGPDPRSPAFEAITTVTTRMPRACRRAMVPRGGGGLRVRRSGTDYPSPVLKNWNGVVRSSTDLA